LLYHQAANPGAPPPFKVAIFICGGVSLQVLEDLGTRVDQEAHDWDRRTKLLLQQKNDAAAVLRSGRDRWGSIKHEDIVLDGSNQWDLQNVFGLDVTQFSEDLKIRIPTVHIYGSRDPRLPASLQLACLCDSEVRKTFDHGGGHDIPRSKEVSKTIAELVRWSVLMAEKARVEE
jgi:pimeloyl-ACP methyl ester carboxylesterase